MVTTDRRSMDRSVVLEEMLTQERAALDPYFGESDPSTYVAMYADDVTYFDAWAEEKLEGDAARTHLMGFAGRIPPFGYEILNPSVQVVGDAAVFSFNLRLTDPGSGEQVAVWNTTEAHRRRDGGWELIHAHWSYAVPPAEA